VLRENKLFVTTVNPKAKFAFDENDGQDPDRVDDYGHLFAGYFFKYPDRSWGRRGDGYVSTVNEDNQLNWVYVDKDTYEVKHGLRVDAEPHHVGPWNVSPIDRRLTFDGWEGFIVVEVEENRWQLYFDVDDNGLEGKVPLTQRIMEVELTRKELRMVKGASILG